VMSSRSHCAVDIIANCIDVGTKQCGGERSGLSLSVWQTPCGARRIRSRDLGFALGAGVNPSKGEGRQAMERFSSVDLEHDSGQGSSRTASIQKSLVATIC
jgi:hypothetical protein